MEKLCEYFNDIGLLELNNINTFLKIYSNISPNNYDNKNERIVHALYSYLSLITKNDQQLYDISKNVVDSFSNNQIVNRYKGLNLINNIFRTKLHSRFNLFLFKINQFLFRQINKNKFRNSQKLPSYTNNNILKENNINNDYLNNYENLNNFPIKKGKIMKKPKNKENDSFNDIIYKLSKEDEFDYFPPPQNVKKNNTRKSKPKSLNNKKMRNINLNYNYDESKYSPYKYNKDFIDINENIYNSKYTPAKYNMNNRYYGYNNGINNQKEKLYEYYNNINNVNIPNNSYYNSYNKFIPVNSRNNEPLNYKNYNNYSYYNDYNNFYPYYYDNNYTFYQKQKDHIKKVEAKIIQLKAKQMNEISEKCTFSPVVHKSPKFKKNKKQLNRCLTSLNLENRKYNINDKNISDNNSIKSQNLLKMKENINKIIDDYMSVNSNDKPKKELKKSKTRSYSTPKLNNNKVESSHIDKMKEYENERAKMFTFKPNINPNNESKSKVFEIPVKKDEKKNNDKQELNNSKNKKKVKRPKSEIEKIFKRLSENKVKKEEKKLKKKPIINWDERFKKHKADYPQDFADNKKNYKPKNKKKLKTNTDIKKEESKENKKDEKIEEKIDDKKEDKNEDNKKEENNNNDEKKDYKKDDKKDESLNTNNNIVQSNDNGNLNGEEKKENDNELNGNNSIYNSIFSSTNLEQKMKEMEEHKLLDNITLNSRALQGIKINQQ